MAATCLDHWPASRAPLVDPPAFASGRPGRRNASAADLHYRIKYLRITRTATKVSGQGMLDLRYARMRLSGKQIVSRHDHPRSAYATLRASMIDKRLLQRAGDSLDGGDLRAFGLHHRNQATVH